MPGHIDGDYVNAKTELTYDDATSLVTSDDHIWTIMDNVDYG